MIKDDFAFGMIPVWREEGEVFFLLVKSVKGYWSFPKGHKEGEETDIETAKRELQEETGIVETDIQSERIFTCTRPFERDGIKYNKINSFFVCFPKSKEIAVSKEFIGEIIEAHWYSVEESKQLLDFLPYTEFIDTIISSLSSS